MFNNSKAIIRDAKICNKDTIIYIYIYFCANGLKHINLSFVCSFIRRLILAFPLLPLSTPVTLLSSSALLILLNFNLSSLLPHCHYITLCNEIMALEM